MDNSQFNEKNSKRNKEARFGHTLRYDWIKIEASMKKQVIPVEIN